MFGQFGLVWVCNRLDRVAQSTEETLAITPPLYLAWLLQNMEVSGRVENETESSKDSLSLTSERGYCRSKCGS